MSTVKHTLLLLLPVLLAYIWLSNPTLNAYSLQAFSVTSLGYFVVKKINKAELWHVLPKNFSLELMFITFAVLLLVGSTGNANSIFYPFTYVHLFILVMSCKEKTAIAVAMATILFHYALEATITSSEIATILTMPMMLLFFLFAKRQYDDAILSHSIINKEEKEIKDLSNQEHTLESFITSFLRPKLEMLEEIVSSDDSDGDEGGNNKETTKNQISLIINESDKILKKIAK